MVKVAAAVGAGDKYREITNVTTLDDDKTPVSIKHEEGTVMMIDFWATWCPPCQKPMAHNQEMLEANKEKWGDKVKIIGLSIDGDAATVKTHVTNKGWTSPIHYWRSKSDCSDVYSVRGVPHVLIVDKEGTIVFKGHPANRKDLAQDFNDLLEGKKLTGEGTGPAAAGGEAEEEEAGKAASLDDIKASLKQMDKFRDIGAELQKDCGDSAKGMMRNFCVMTVEADYNATKGAWTNTFTNHRVFVGAQEKIDACMEKIKEKLGTKDDKKEWTFEINEQT